MSACGVNKAKEFTDGRHDMTGLGGDVDSSSSSSSSI